MVMKAMKPVSKSLYDALEIVRRDALERSASQTLKLIEPDTPTGGPKRNKEYCEQQRTEANTVADYCYFRQRQIQRDSE